MKTSRSQCSDSSNASELGPLRLGRAVGLQRLELRAAAAGEEEHRGEKQWPAHPLKSRS